MNERIKELLEDATEIHDDRSGNSYRVVDYKIFAELIVRECIDCAVAVGHADNRPVEPVYTIHEVKRQILKHFGVE